MFMKFEKYLCEIPIEILSIYIMLVYAGMEET